MMTRTTALGALMALAATTLGVAQSTPPTNSTMTPSHSSTSQTPSDNMNNDSSNATSSNTGDKVGQDPKMKACMTSEKAKNTGLSENEMKQKCMMQIASHQGQSK